MRYRNRRRTAAEWAANDEVIGQGEIALVVAATPTGAVTEMRLGDGVSTFSALSAFSTGGGGGGGASVQSGALSSSTTLAASPTAIINYVATQISGLINSAPGALDTLNELAAALGNDANYAATITTALATKVPSTRTVGGSALSGDIPLKTVAGVAVVGTGDIPITVAAAADKSTINLPSVNTPLATALAALAPLNVSVDLGTGASTLTASTNADRYNYWHGTTDTTLATNTTSAVRGQMITVGHEGTSGTLTLGATAPTGYKNTLSVGETGQIVFNGTGWQSAIPAGGSSVALATVTGSSTVGSVLTCTPASGWTGTFQWRQDGVDISGATSSTYTLVGGDAGHVITCKFTPTFYTSNGITAALTAPGTVTGLTLGTATATTQPLSWTAPSSGGAPSDYEIQYALAGSGSWSTFSDGTSTTPSTTVTGLTASTSYDYRVRATNSAGNGSYSSTATGSTGASAFLTYTATEMAAGENLTTAGYEDYVVERALGNWTYVQKATTSGGTTPVGLIVRAILRGSGIAVNAANKDPAVYSWTDGVDNTSAASSGDNSAGTVLDVNDDGTFQTTRQVGLTAPASTTPHYFSVVVGCYGNYGSDPTDNLFRIRATLSDGSVTPIDLPIRTDTTESRGGVNSTMWTKYTFHYKAGTTGTINVDVGIYPGSGVDAAGGSHCYIQAAMYEVTG